MILWSAPKILINTADNLFDVFFGKLAINRQPDQAFTIVITPWQLSVSVYSRIKIRPMQRQIMEDGIDVVIFQKRQ